MLNLQLSKIRIIPVLLLLVLFTLYSITTVQAHVGGGPPFLTVNGEYAQTNPLIITYPDSELLVAQDILTKNPVTGTPIEFRIETDKLAIEPNLQKTALFRWSWGDSSEVSTGKQVTHSYSKDGSYLVVVEMGFPGQDNYIILDTLQVQSVPHSNYVLPKPHITLTPDKVEIGKPVHFSYETVKEKGAYITTQKWRLDNNQYSSEKTPVHTYIAPDSTNIIIVKVTDSNGFVGFAGTALDSTNGIVEKKDISNSGNLVSQSVVRQRQLFYYGIIGFLAVCIIVFFVSRKVHKKGI